MNNIQMLRGRRVDAGDTVVKRHGAIKMLYVCPYGCAYENYFDCPFRPTDDEAPVPSVYDKIRIYEPIPNCPMKARGEDTICYKYKDVEGDTSMNYNGKIRTAIKINDYFIAEDDIVEFRVVHSVNASVGFSLAHSTTYIGRVTEVSTDKVTIDLSKQYNANVVTLTFEKLACLRPHDPEKPAVF